MTRVTTRASAGQITHRQTGYPGRVLYLSYDGMLEPLGESQVVSYLERLAVDRSVTLLSFEKHSDLMDDARRVAMRRRLEAAGIRWIVKRYHHRPYAVAKAYDILTALAVGLRWGRGRGPRLIHARGYLPALMALVIRACVPARFIFDMRGFWADERVEAGLWRSGGRVHRTVKRLERRFFEGADAIISLTHDGVRAFDTLGYRIAPSTVVTVISTCVDLDRFRPGAKSATRLAQLQLEDSIVLGCVGTMSGWYLRKEMLRYLGLLVGRIERAKVLIVTREDHHVLRADARAAGLDDSAIRLVRADFREMPELYRLIDLGLLLLRPSFSERARASTRVGELLASGVPVIMNRSGGDASSIIVEEHAGLVLPDTTDGAFQGSIEDVHRLLDDRDASRRCRLAAERHFDLRAGVSRYGALYDQLAARG